MGMQIPCGVHPEIQEEGNIQQSRKCTGRTAPRVRRAEGERDSRGACHEGPRPHADMHSTKVQCLAGRGVCQVEERNLDCAELFREAAELRWAALLGVRILREHRGARREGDCGVHPQSGEDGYSGGPPAWAGVLKSDGPRLQAHPITK